MRVKYDFVIKTSDMTDMPVIKAQSLTPSKTYNV